MKTVVITGASRGIGLAMVKRFKSAGYRVAACSSTPAIERVGEADYRGVCDVTDPKAVRDWVGRAVDALGGRVDVLINNAGLAGSNSLEPEHSDDLWHRIVDVNLHGTYYFCKDVAPRMPDGQGAIINIASVLALQGVPDQTAYCAAKHAVLGFTRALSHALAPRKITVNAICPGWTRTEMAQRRMRELGLDEAALGAGVPLGRFIEPEEVAEMAWYLAGSGARGVTGQALTIDGGASA